MRPPLGSERVALGKALLRRAVAIPHLYPSAVPAHIRGMRVEAFADIVHQRVADFAPTLLDRSVAIPYLDPPAVGSKIGCVDIEALARETHNFLAAHGP